MRPIDADALHEKIMHLYDVDKKATGANAYDLCAMLIEDAPTIEPNSEHCLFCKDADVLNQIVCYLPFDNGSDINVPINFCPGCGKKIDNN